MWLARCSAVSLEDCLQKSGVNRKQNGASTIKPDCSLINQTTPEEVGAAECLQSIQHLPLREHRLRETQEQKTLLLQCFGFEPWLCHADEDWANACVMVICGKWKWTFLVAAFKIIYESRSFLSLFQFDYVNSSWLHDSLVQAALQGASSVHPRASLLLLLQLLSWEEASADWTNVDQWRRTNRGGRRQEGL